MTAHFVTSLKSSRFLARSRTCSTFLASIVEAQSTCTLRIRRQEEYRPHSRTPSGPISGPGHGCQEVQSLHSRNVIHESG